MLYDNIRFHHALTKGTENYKQQTHSSVEREYVNSLPRRAE